MLPNDLLRLVKSLSAALRPAPWGKYAPWGGGVKGHWWVFTYLTHNAGQWR